MESALIPTSCMSTLLWILLTIKLDAPPASLGSPLKSASSPSNPFRRIRSSPAALALFRGLPNKREVDASPLGIKSTPNLKRIRNVGIRLLAEAQLCQRELSSCSFKINDVRGYGSSDGEWRCYTHSRMRNGCSPRRSLRIACKLLASN
jgi:hypothetical protein